MNKLLLLIYLVPVLLLGYWLVRRGVQPRAAADATASALAALKKRGADLAKPASVRFVLSFETRAAAEAAAREIPTEWTTQILEMPEPPRWRCRVTTKMIPVHAELSARAQELEATAMRHGGEYEGWEADV
jgi:Regulator of ribonuclease activity B